MNKSDKSCFKDLAEICKVNLKNSDECLNYLSDRKFSNEIIDKFGIGYFPQNVSKLKEYIPEKFLYQYNILSKDGYCDFASRYYLVFPIYNEYNDVIAMMGRTLISEEKRKILGISKYKNTSYKKSESLYGLNFSRKNILNKNNVYVVEGNFDVIKMYQSGITNSVGICGTAFSRNHMIRLSRYSDRITFIMDNDDAGEKAMQRIAKLFDNRGVILRFLKLPNKYKDIDEYLNVNDKSNLKNDLKNICFSVY